MNDQAGLRGLPQKILEEPVDEPLTSRSHTGAHADPVERLGDLVDAVDVWATDERRRTLGQDRRDGVHHLDALLPVGDEDFELELLRPAREHPH